MPYRPPTHELGSLRPRCVEGCQRPVEKQFDRCFVCQARHGFTGFLKDYPISEPTLKEIGT